MIEEQSDQQVDTPKASTASYESHVVGEADAPALVSDRGENEPASTTTSSTLAEHYSNHANTNLRRRRDKNFANAKTQCLGKRDKSSAGRIDPRAVEICGIINEKFECYYTTSSCAGRCFLYQGKGVKSSHYLNDTSASVEAENTVSQQQPSASSPSPHFTRCRVSHDLIRNAQRYFDLTTLESDPSGGGDAIPTIGQYEYKQQQEQDDGQRETTKDTTATTTASSTDHDQSVWLRFEPFILHVACRSLGTASALMNAARPAFKNVGLTHVGDDKKKSHKTQASKKFIVAIWGDEGVDMPLSTPDGMPLFGSASANVDWLARLVNERHERNWEKIDRFVQAVRSMPIPTTDDELLSDQNDGYYNPTMIDDEQNQSSSSVRIPKSFDVIGDVALLHALPESTSEQDEESLKALGEAIMKRNKAIKVVALRQSNLVGIERAPGEQGLQIIAGAQRKPLVTSHMEYGIKVAVDLNHTFFSPRMGQERLRICQQVARGEHVLVLFCGVGMDACQLAGRTEASSVTAVEYNEVAIQCCRRSKRYLEKNKTVKCTGAGERLSIREGDVLDVLPTLPRAHYDRVLVPRPKEGALDGDLGDGDSGIQFLQAILPVLKPLGGECHWYDFVSTNEYPSCERSRQFLTRVGAENGLEVEILHVANAGSVAMRQLRACIDFRVRPKQEGAK